MVRVIRIPSLAFIVGVALARAAFGQTFTTTSFAPPVEFIVTNGMSGLRIVDVDGDGRPDLVFIAGSNTVAVMQNTGVKPGIVTNSFAPAIAYRAGASLQGLAVADLNRDGLPDLIVVGAEGVSILQNQGQAGRLTGSSFGPAVVITKPLPMSAIKAYVAAGDLDGDRWPDLIYTLPGSNSVAVLHNTALPGVLTSNSFAPPVFFPVGLPASIVLANLVDDGRPDVFAIGLANAATGAVLRNLSTPGTLVLTEGGGAVLGRALGDLDGDGKVDWVDWINPTRPWPGIGPFPEVGFATIQLNHSTPGQPAFGLPLRFPLPYAPYFLMVNDLDGDGRADFIFGSQAPMLFTNFPSPVTITSDVSVLRNTIVAGQVVPRLSETAVDLPPVVNLLSLQAVDVDGDSKPDLIMTRRGETTNTTVISIWRNQVVPLPEVDLLAPPGGRRYAAGSSVTFNAYTFHLPGPTQRVEMYQDGNLLGTTTTVPYVFEVVVSPPGQHALTARAVTSLGQTFDSQPLEIEILGQSSAKLAPLRLAAEPSSGSSYVIDTNHQLYAWGDNSHGQLGLGQPFPEITTPMLVTPPTGVAGWASVAGGLRHALGVSLDGQLFAWGANDYGQLGLPLARTDQTAPVRIANPAPVVAWSDVAAGQIFSLAVASDGTLWAWGANEHGQLGLGHTYQQPVPTPVPFPNGAHGWLAVVAGGGHSLAIADSGELYAWGYNKFGQVGNGNTNDQTVPFLVPRPVGVQQWTAAVAGNVYSLALADDSNQYGWGLNFYNVLALGGPVTNLTVVVTTPQLSLKPAGVTNWQAITAGGSHSLALGSDEQLYAWGDNQEGELGTGNTAFSVSNNVPMPVVLPGGVTSWKAVSAGSMHTLAIGDNDRLYVWGGNGAGQLGNGNAHSTGGLFGLFSPIPLSICSTDAVCAGVTNLPPLVAITSPTNGASFLTPASFTTSVAALDADGFVDEVELFLVTVQEGTVRSSWTTNKLGARFTPPFVFPITNLTNSVSRPPTLYNQAYLLARATDDSGATTDSAMVSLDLVAPPNLGIGPLLPLVTQAAPNPYTGFYEQRLQIINASTLVLPAIQVVITNLPADVRVMNATSQTNGLATIEWDFALPALTNVILTIEFDHRPSAMPGFNALVVSPAIPPQLSGTFLEVSKFAWLTNQTFGIEFAAAPARTCFVQYSADLQTWTTSLPPVSGTTNSMRWVDNGPPRTASAPGRQASRFYRVLAVP